MADRRKLQRVVERLQRTMPAFVWTTLSAQEVAAEGTYDPPRDLVRGILGPFRVDICGAGEVHTAMDTKGTAVGALDMSQPPELIAWAALGALKEMTP